MRECDCPPWVIRCSHFAGGIATLTDTRLVVPAKGCRCAASAVPFTYSSGYFRGTWDRCPHGVGIILFSIGLGLDTHTHAGTPGIYESEVRGENTYRGDDLNAALVGFAAAQVQLGKDA